MANKYSALHTLAGVMLALSVILIIGSMISIAYQMLSSNYVNYVVVGVSFGGIVLSLFIMTFARFIDMAIDIANKIVKD